MHDLTTHHEAHRALREVDRQRAEMAERIRLPGWFVVLYGAALVALFVVPGLSARPGHALSNAVVLAVITAGVAVLGLLSAVLDRAAGARLRSDRASAHVSAKRPMFVTTWIVLAGSLATWITAQTVSWALSVVVGLVVAALALLGRQRTIAAIRDDVRRGRPASP